MIGYQTVLTLTGEEEIFAIALSRALHINKNKTLAIICFSLFLNFQAFLNLYEGLQESLKPNIH